MHKLALLGILTAMLPAVSLATELHVATTGDDENAGTKSAPLRTIQRAAELAQPGDTVTVHQGVYRERVDPPRGGTSETNRITYQAAQGEKVEIKGSEMVKGWVKESGEVWKATLPNALFKGFNPYSDVIHGDWFDPRGRVHHTGAVYLNGEWLIEATKLEDLMLPAGTRPAWLDSNGQYLLNVAWLKVGADKVPASQFAAKQGVQAAPCSEGGDCIGYIEHGSWVRYDGVDFGKDSNQIEFRVASASDGGVIEIRRDNADGELMGKGDVQGTGDWQSWTTIKAKIKTTSGKQTICLVFRNRQPAPTKSAATSPPLWFAEVGGSQTTIWAQFPGVDPNKQVVEANVRQTVFYPSRTGRDYITVRGFTMAQAATPWAPPTAEQIGLIGTNWSKGWIIENNVVSHSVCSGISLGKYGDRWDNTSANSAEGYVKTIERALANGWTMEKIGGHVVRNNTISFCEQTGIVGSLGPIRCLIEGNVIHDIHVRGLFSGAEMAGIKFHGAIDTVIRGNHIYRTCLGVWLDWMAQGTQVSRNLFHDNAGIDLFVEVDHGPFVVDNNLFLSPGNLLDVSEGGAYVHNLFAGTITGSPEPNRETPWHEPHSTAVAGLKNVRGGDDRFYNNIFVGKGEGGSYGLSIYDERKYPLFTGGNAYFDGARPYAGEDKPIIGGRPTLKLMNRGGRYYLDVAFGDLGVAEWVTTRLLGKTVVAGLPYENADGSPLKIDVDFFGKRRTGSKPVPGPFAEPGAGMLRVW